MLPDAEISIRNFTHVAEARRIAFEMGRESQMPQEHCDVSALVVTELATNLIKHAQSGAIILRQVAGPALEIFSVDCGPGMEDTNQCFEDGYTTASSPGTGLGAVRRLSSVVEVFSRPGSGTVLLACVGSASGAEVNMGALSIPFPGETICGDSWLLQRNSGCLQITVADGLGHGEKAAEASLLAVRIAEEKSGQKPDLVVQAIHRGLRGTRGAAVSTALVQLSGNLVEYAGAGNISASLVSYGKPRQQLISMNGTAGADIPKLQTFRYSWVPGSLLILHSDGISANWSLARYPGLHTAHPALIGAVLFRDYRRGRDDATVVVLRL